LTGEIRIGPENRGACPTLPGEVGQALPPANRLLSQLRERESRLPVAKPRNGTEVSLCTGSSYVVVREQFTRPASIARLAKARNQPISRVLRSLTGMADEVLYM